MTLRVECPACQTRYDLPDNLAGKKARCKTCSGMFVVEAAPVVVEVLPEPLPEPEPVPAPPPADALQPSPPGRRPMRDDDPDDDRPRPRRREAKKSGGGGVLALVLGLVFFVLFLGAAVVAAIWWFRPTPPSGPVAGSTPGGVDRKVEPYNITEARQSVVHIKCLTPGLPDATGSGFLVTDEGLIYTNRHVILPALNLRGVKLLVGVPARDDPDKLDYFPAEIVKASPPSDSLDFAILKIAARPEYGRFHALPLYEGEDLQLGTAVAVVGYPSTVADALPTLSFNKGSISGREVLVEKRAYYQTDAAVNPGNSGGPMLNERGEVVGMVTLKKANANNMGYALHLREMRPHTNLDPEKLARLKVEPGPLDARQLEQTAGKPLPASAWDVRRGTLKEERSAMLLDNRGEPYWMTTKDPIPENFQLTMHCFVAFPANEVRIQSSQRSIVRTLCVRFSSAEPDKEILDPTGYLFVYSRSFLRLSREKQEVLVARQGSPEGEGFFLTVTRDKGEITFSVDGETVMRYEDFSPIKGRSRLSIGGYLSRLIVSNIHLVPLDDGTGPLVQVPKPDPVTPPRTGAPDTVPLSSPANDATLAGNGRYLICHLPRVKKLAVFDTREAKVVKELPLLDETARTAGGLDRLVVFYPALGKIERWNLRTFERETTVDQPFKGTVKRACMGVNSQGPILAVGDGEFPLGNGALLDLESLKPLATSTKVPFPFDYALAAARGDVFSLYATRGTEGCANLIVHGDDVKLHRLPRGPGYLLPSTDGELFYSHRYDKPDGGTSTSGCQLTLDLKLRKGPDDSGAERRPGTVLQRPFYYDLKLGKTSSKLTFFTGAHDKQFAESTEVALGEPEWANEVIPWHTRLSVIPEAKRIVVLPATNDRLLVYPFDVDAALKKANVDYLYVTSDPPRTAIKGEAYSYPIDVTAKQEGVRFTLASGPAGMTVSADEGTVNWKVPADHAGGPVTFVIQVKDRSGLTATHTCRIVVEGASP